jgi:hypothetical protein
MTLRLSLRPTQTVSPVRVDVAAGTMRASITTVRSGTGPTIDVTITPDAITASGDVQDIVLSSGPEVGLSVHVDTNQDGQPAAGYAWDAPARIGPGSVSMISPAVLTRYTAVGHDTQMTTLCGSSPAVQFSVDTTGGPSNRLATGQTQGP